MHTQCMVSDAPSKLICFVDPGKLGNLARVIQNQELTWTPAYEAEQNGVCILVVIDSGQVSHLTFETGFT